MSKIAVYLSVAIAAATLAVGGISWFYLDQSGEARTQSYLELAQTYTIAFSDRAALYLARGQPQDLGLLASTASTLLFGKVILYVQVVAAGELIVDERAPEANALELPLLAPPYALDRSVETLPDGTLYVDVKKDLFPVQRQDEPPLAGYVRVGTSLSQLQADLGVERALTLAIALAVWMVLLLCAWLSTRWLFTVKSIIRPVEPSLPVASIPTPAQGDAPASVPAANLRRIGQLGIDDVRKQVEVRGRPVELSPKEFDLLTLLCAEPGRVYSNEEILGKIWAQHSFASAQDVKQYVYFLRRKLELDPKKPTIILTVRGFGYKVGTG